MNPLYFLIGIALPTSYTTGNLHPDSSNIYIVANDSVFDKTEQLRYEVIKQLINDSSAIVVDVRTAEEFEKGHIEHSINIPLHVLENNSSILKQQDNIIVVCRRGKRSLQAKTLLTLKGFNKVHDGGSWETLNKIIKSNN